MEERLEKRCDDIYFPFDVRLGGLDNQAEWLQKEVKAIQRQLASEHQISASITRKCSKSIDSKASASTDKHLVASIDTTSTPDDEQLIQNKMESMHEELNELSTYAYDKIGWHQFSIENILEMLQNISNAIQKMDERWTRNDEATRKMRTEIESMQHNLEKEATTSPSIDANKATSIDVKPQTSQIPAEPESLAEKKDEWEIAYINTGINDVYNPLKNNVDWLSTRIDLLQQDLDTIRKKDPQPATSIDICTIRSIDSKFAAMEDRFRRASLDGKKPTEHLPYTTAEVDHITSKLYTALDTMEERLEKRCDDIYFPFDVRLGGLGSQAEWLQKEVKAIQRQLASQHQTSASITRKRSKSIDSKTPASTDKHLVASIDTTSTPGDEQLIQNKMESMHEELNELSAYAYDKIGWHQFSIENILERLQNISNAIQKMDERWIRNDEATRSFIAAWSRIETKETEENIRRMFHHVRERMKLRITLKKKSDPGKFAIPCVVKGIEFPHALCDTGASVNLVELGNDLGYIAACHCGAEYETEYSEWIDTHTASSIDSNASSIDSNASSIDSNESPTTDECYPTSLDGKQPVDHFTFPDQCYPNFSFQQPNKIGRDDYSIGSWTDSGFHESFAVETVIPSSNENPTEEYDEDYWKERAIEIAMQDDRYSSHSFNNTPTPSIDRVYSASVDTHPHPAK
ncbi:hypothetical protein DY000_02038266 [Brassica cretica]|uniref:Peptidase A2 domain-containing protein n=1 Tax=Brassica cretica TaxID=69181 RepID=A0ABQ7BI78_BRACR|nr:hypothetical protein DY000_02038266 [Brassica cretica]